eukprot:TRINITY_DN9907_c1_g1_i1.p1 TRINITY_DN9907_c1_g1~~TRINITY_DN9907_c1_g1_i1.p1  ORF type:complete len:401 (-),score=57.55 TRINITY_DN9907_c1_g1_i1:127-1329(-)
MHRCLYRRVAAFAIALPSLCTFFLTRRLSFVNLHCAKQLSDKDLGRPPDIAAAAAEADESSSVFDQIRVQKRRKLSKKKRQQKALYALQEYERLSAELDNRDFPSNSSAIDGREALVQEESQLNPRRPEKRKKPKLSARKKYVLDAWITEESVEDSRTKLGILRTQEGEDMLGVEAYYNNTIWYNPLERQLRACLHTALELWNSRGLFNKSDYDADTHPLGKVLDLACGSGEASLALLDWAEGWHGAVKCLEAADPFNSDSYLLRTGRRAHLWSFEDVAEGVLAAKCREVETGLLEPAFDLVLCSFAMHLLKDPMLHKTLQALSEASRLLLIVSSREEPIVRHEESGWVLLDQLRCVKVADEDMEWQWITDRKFQRLKPGLCLVQIRLALYQSESFGGGW